MNIGEASRASGVSAKMIRYYENLGLIHRAQRTTSGYRVYTPADVHTLQFIKRARDLGFSLERIRLLVGLWHDTSRRSSDVKTLARRYISELDQDIAKLQSIRDQLAHLSACCQGDHRPDCPILADLAGANAVEPNAAHVPDNVVLGHSAV